MKLRNLMIILAITFSGTVFSACTDEAENIIPQPTHTAETPATVGTEGEDGDVD